MTSVLHDVGPVAWLRVYEPLAIFPAAEKARYEEQLAETGPPNVRSAVATERTAALHAIIRPRLDLGDQQGALLRRVDDLWFVCPLRTQLRVWEGFTAFAQTRADVIVEGFVPRPEITAAETAQRAYLAAGESSRSHVLTETWVVPMPWHLAVERSERTLVLGSGTADPRRACTFDTTMAHARRRLARTLQVLRRTIPEAAPVEAVESLARWLEDFHPHSRVEVDYGGLVSLVDDDWLRSDSSAEDLAAGVAALKNGDGDGASKAYEAFVGRWRVVSAKETAS